MSLQGLPDFDSLIQTDHSQTFYAYEQPGNGMVLPNAVEVVPEDFSLVLVRGQNPTLLPKPHGILTVRLQPIYPMTEALEELRSQHNAFAIAQPVLFKSGFLRLYPAHRSDPIPDDLTVPVPLGWNGLTTARYCLTLTESTAIVLKKALSGDLLPLKAIAEMEIVGVAPRLPLRVQFDPAVLLDQLAAFGNAQRQVPCEAITRFFRQAVRSLPLKIVGDLPAEGFAETMTDWVRAHFGTFIACPTDAGDPHLAIATHAAGSIEWDLSQPLQAYRTIVLSLDPLAAAQQLVQTKGLDAIFQEVTVPPIQTGTWAIDVAANLPDHRPGIISIEVTLKAPPVLPHRPQARIVTADLLPPEDTAQVMLRLSPMEKLAYMVSTTVVLQDSSGVQQLTGEEIMHTGSRLSLRPDQFPITFIPIEATRSLLELATIVGVCRWQEGEIAKSQSFELSKNQPAIALVLPKSTTAAMLDLSARAIESNQTLQIPPFPAKNCQIGLHAFPEFGTHQIDVDCKFDEGDNLYAIDLLPEGVPESEASLLFFTPAQSRKTWRWLAKSPFQAGYRYRPHAEPSIPWSTVQSPFTALKISSRGFLPHEVSSN
jgi:hypothetical protein